MQRRSYAVLLGLLVVIAVPAALADEDPVPIECGPQPDDGSATMQRGVDFVGQNDGDTLLRRAPGTAGPYATPASLRPDPTGGRRARAVIGGAALAGAPGGVFMTPQRRTANEIRRLIRRLN